MANEIVKLKRGKKASMPAKEAGSILIATDTGEAYVDDTATSRVQIKDTTKLPLSGGTMTGPINMGSHKITSLATPTDNADAATKKYVDDAKSSAASSGSTAAANVASQVVSGTTDVIDVVRSTQSSGIKNKDTVSHAAVLATGAANTNYGPTAAATLSYGGSFNVPRIQVDKYGHVKVVGHYAMKLPSAVSVPKDPNIQVYVCTTAADTASKSITTHRDAIESGDIFAVIFTNGNTSSVMTLTYDSTSHAVSASSFASLANIPANGICLFKDTTSSSGTSAQLVGVITGPYAVSGPITMQGGVIGLSAPYSAGSAGPGTDASPSYGQSFTVPQVTRDAYGRVTGLTSRTITLPAAPTQVTYSSGTCITVSGGKISHTSPYSAAASAGPSENSSPGFGGTIKVPQITRDNQGHVSGLTERTITLPANPQTTYTGSSPIVVSGTTISHAGQTAVNSGPSANSSPGFGGTITVPQIVTNTTGHVTSAPARTITLPQAKLTSAVSDSSVQFRNIVVVAKGTDPATVNCPVGTIIMVKEE